MASNNSSYDASYQSLSYDTAAKYDSIPQYDSNAQSSYNTSSGGQQSADDKIYEQHTESVQDNYSSAEQNFDKQNYSEHTYNELAYTTSDQTDYTNDTNNGQTEQENEAIYANIDTIVSTDNEVIQVGVLAFNSFHEINLFSQRERRFIS